MNEASAIVQKLRREPFSAFSLTHNCIGKSLRFRKKCREIGVHAKAVIAFGFVPCKKLLLPPYMPTFHCWGELDGQRIELTRPLFVLSIWGTFDNDMKPLVMIRM